jgi:hypothetical protein
VSDFLFDDTTWKIRWLVVDTAKWLTGRKVLIHPSAIGQADSEFRRLPVVLTKSQVENSPDILEDGPVSRQKEESLYGYYGWDPLWGGRSYGGGGMAYPLLAPIYFGGHEHQEAEAIAPRQDDADPHLRSVAAVTGYHIHAIDGRIGHLSDVMIDDSNWEIHYFIVDTRNWWPGRDVLMSPHAVRSIEWSTREIHLDVSRDKVEASPVWDPTDVIHRPYEVRLHGYYDWPGYGW